MKNEKAITYAEAAATGGASRWVREAAGPVGSRAVREGSTMISTFMGRSVFFE